MRKRPGGTAAGPGCTARGAPGRAQGQGRSGTRFLRVTSGRGRLFSVPTRKVILTCVCARVAGVGHSLIPSTRAPHQGPVSASNRRPDGDPRARPSGTRGPGRPPHAGCRHTGPPGARPRVPARPAVPLRRRGPRTRPSPPPTRALLGLPGLSLPAPPRRESPQVTWGGEGDAGRHPATTGARGHVSCIRGALHEEMHMPEWLEGPEIGLRGRKMVQQKTSSQRPR